MHIERRALKDVPKDAIIMSDQEVLKHYHNYIFGTSQTKAIRPLKYGFVFGGCTAFVSNYWLLNYYRKRLKLSGPFINLFMSMSLVALPAGFAAGIHFSHCLSAILLDNMCTSCLYMRAVFIQNVFGVLYAVVPSAFITMSFAALRYTYPVPGFSNLEDVKESYQLWLKLTKRIVPRILLVTLANTVMIAGITAAEIKSFGEMTSILAKQNERLRALAAEYQNENRSQ